MFLALMLIEIELFKMLLNQFANIFCYDNIKL